MPALAQDKSEENFNFANSKVSFSGLVSALPLLALDADVERKSRRNALTSGVAAAFPFASYELSDRNGIFLGLNLLI